MHYIDDIGFPPSRHEVEMRERAHQEERAQRERQERLRQEYFEPRPARQDDVDKLRKDFEAALLRIEKLEAQLAPPELGKARFPAIT